MGPQAHLHPQGLHILSVLQGGGHVDDVHRGGKHLPRLAVQADLLLEWQAVLGAHQGMPRHAGGVAHGEIHRAGNSGMAVRSAQDVLHPGFAAAKQGFLRLQGRGYLKFALDQPLGVPAAHGALQGYRLGEHLGRFLLQAGNHADLLLPHALGGHVQFGLHQNAPVEHPGGDGGDLAYRLICRSGILCGRGKRTAEIPAFLHAAHPGQIPLGIEGPKGHPPGHIDPIPHSLRRQRQGLGLGIKQKHLVPKASGQRGLRLHGHLLGLGPQPAGRLYGFSLHGHIHRLIPPSISALCYVTKVQDMRLFFFFALLDNWAELCYTGFSGR